VARFFPAMFSHVKGPAAGQAFTLEPWQRRFVEEFTSTNGEGERIYKRGLLGVARGNGKSPLAAGLALRELVSASDEPDEAGKKRGTIKKSINYLGSVLDEARIDPNPARSDRVRLPHEDKEEIDPPSADHVEAIFRLLPSAYRTAFLWLDWSGARLASVVQTRIGTTTRSGSASASGRRRLRTARPSGRSSTRRSPRRLRRVSLLGRTAIPRRRCSASSAMTPYGRR